MSVPFSPGPNPHVEYEDRHTPFRILSRVRSGAAQGPAAAMPAVDEIPQKKYVLHMPESTFPQVRRFPGTKLF
jgi:hypothetical protein